MRPAVSHRLLLPLAACISFASGCEFIVGTSNLGKPLPEELGDQSGGLDAGTDASDGVIRDAQVDASDPTACTTNSECMERLGAHHICNRVRGTCAPLLSEHCTEVIGDYTNDDALLLGSIGPTTGPNYSTGLSNLWGIKLAVQDFTVLGNGGLPAVDEGGRRPIVVVHCDDAASAEQAVAGARHLVDDVGVSAIIGPSFSGITLSVASRVTVPAGVLTISPSATSASITYSPDNNLLWRTAPSDVVQAKAQALLAEQVGQKIRELQRVKPNNPLKLLMLHKGDAYGIGLAEDVARNLIWNPEVDAALLDPNAPAVQRFDYGDPGNPTSVPTQYAGALAKTLAMQPHVVLLYGTAEVAQLLEMIETSWPGDAPEPGPPPHYVFADGGHTTELIDMIRKLDPLGENRLADRVFGTEPGFLGSNYKLFEQLYVSKAEAPPVPITFGSANAYDALYVLAYASVIAGKRHPTGAELAAAIARLVPAEGAVPTDVGANRINGALQALSADGHLDLSGASGPLDFDLKTGDVASGILFWCAQVQADGSLKLVPTLETYNPVLNEIEQVAEEPARCGQYEEPILEDPVPEEPVP